MNIKHRIRELEERVVQLIAERDAVPRTDKEMEMLVRRELCL